MIVQRLEKLILEHSLLAADDRVVVGVSAGSDSVALLSLLCSVNLPLSPIAVYVNHGLRPEESENEEQLVRNLAQRFAVPHHIITVDVCKYRREQRCSPEEAARILRYQGLESCRLHYDAAAIAIAHTADDQAEEVLLRLIRGTGLNGLSGMRLHKGKIVRPLLGERKSDLIAYLEASSIPYCYDSSNSDPIFLRNRVRLQLLPLLEQQFSPAIRTHLLQTTSILQEDDDFLERATENSFAKSVTTPSPSSPASLSGVCYLLDLLSFEQFHRAIRRRILEKMCWVLEVAATFRLIEQLHSLATEGKNGAVLHLTRGLRVFKTPASLHFSRPWGKSIVRGNPLPNKEPTLRIAGPGTYTVKNLNMTLLLRETDIRPPEIDADTLVVDGEKITFPLLLRPMHEGERFIPLGMTHSKKISRFLSDLKIARHLRHFYPILESDTFPVAVVGLRVDQRFAFTESTTKFLEMKWLPATDPEKGDQ